MDVSFDEFVAICESPLGNIAMPLAEAAIDGVAIYRGDDLRDAASTTSGAAAARDELATVLDQGPGVLVVRDAWPDRAQLRQVESAFWAIVESERDRQPEADHFAAAGANTRIWDALGKLAAVDPVLYVDYYGNPVLHLLSEAWLGPWYQTTAQVNIVHPGGAAQSPHRDYHLGFLSDETAARFPAHIHRSSPYLTLQGAIAHSAMPIEAGPTMVLPGSQRFEAGYLAYRDERFRDYFAKRRAQLALDMGDAMFFNPAIFHGAGTNRTVDHERIANVLQISSAFGVAMERVDWQTIALRTYPTLLARAERGELRPEHVAVCAAGYAFPSNLDTDPAQGGLAPPSAQQLLTESLDARLDPSEFEVALDALVARKRVGEAL